MRPAENLRILVVDDDPEYRDTLEGAVRRLGYECRVARDGLEAWQLHEASPADVILSDWKMPRMSGVDLCAKVRGDDSGRPYTHFVLVTGNDDKAHFIEGMHAGADDFLPKPVDLDALEARLEVAKRLVLLNRDLESENASLKRDSERAYVAVRTDPLTGMLNRFALEEDLERLAARAERYGHGYCAALCDVDGFKAYNDHFGHLAGDEALRSIAQAIRGALRRGDVCYRYGGEEFLVILPEQSLEEATCGIDRIRRVVEWLAIPHAPSTNRPFVTLSAGIAVLSHAPPESIRAWLERADAALYAAKANGRNRVTVAQHD